MKKHSIGFSGAGISSLIIVFTVLALVIFTMLTLLTVRQDLELSRKTAEAQTEFYAADAAATERLGKLNMLAEENPNGDLLAFVAQNEGYTVNMDDGRLIIGWSEDISDKSRLECEAEYTDGSLEIIKWQTVQNDSYVNEGSLPIWDGKSPPAPAQ